MVNLPPSTGDSHDYEVIAPGEYLAEIIEIESKLSRSDTEYLSVKFAILEGDYSGRYVWSNLNLWHPDSKAQWHAQKELAAICRACGMDRDAVHDSDELLNHRVLITVKHRTHGENIYINITDYDRGPTESKATTAQPAGAEEDPTADIPW